MNSEYTNMIDWSLLVANVVINVFGEFFGDPEEFWKIMGADFRYNFYKRKEDSVFWMTFEEIILHNGFEFERHKVTTEDGYILHVFRIKMKEERRNINPTYFK